MSCCCIHLGCAHCSHKLEIKGVCLARGHIPCTAGDGLLQMTLTCQVMPFDSCEASRSLLWAYVPVPARQVNTSSVRLLYLRTVQDMRDGIRVTLN